MQDVKKYPQMWITTQPYRNRTGIQEKPLLRTDDGRFDELVLRIFDKRPYDAMNDRYSIHHPEHPIFRKVQYAYLDAHPLWEKIKKVVEAESQALPAS